MENTTNDLRALPIEAQIKKLEAENERLRQALEQIAKKHPGFGGVGDIARRSLRHNAKDQTP